MLGPEKFGDQLPEKKLQLVGMSILLILLSPGPGCHNVKTAFHNGNLTEDVYMMQLLTVLKLEIKPSTLASFHNI